ncbi:MAG TPA: hypothetical protein RMH99_24865 [Sandaracinaceae bacterium LLY-WYZ-13_1]|nr:hypothetical protein [Sandaracinaceae bacterium LLY-WYZ-13_1]
MRRVRAAVTARRLAALGLGLALGACDGGGALDGGAADRPTGDAATTPGPAPATRPALECPAGWREISDGDTVACDPTGALSECPDGQAHFPGAEGCAPVGRACPAGDFPEDLGEGARYVRPGADGDGRRDAPYGTIAEALVGAGPGTVIALSAGTHEAGFALPAGVTVRGVCAARTRLRRSSDRGVSVDVPDGVTGAVLADVGLASSDNLGMTVAGEVRLEGVAVEGAMLFGVLVEGGTLDAEGLVVRDTRPGPDGSQGGGIAVVAGTLSLARAVLEGNRQFGLAVGDGRAELADVASRSQREGARPGLGAGLAVEAGGVVIGERVELTDALGVGATVSEGGRLELTDAAVRRVRGVGRADQGFGVAVRGAFATLTRAWIDDAQGTAIAVLDASDVRLTDVRVTDTVPYEAEPGWAVGLSIGRGSLVTVERVLVRGGAGAGVSAIGDAADPPGEETVLSATDLTVQDVAHLGLSGVGLYLDGAHVEVRRLAVARTVEAAIIASGGSELSLHDALVEDTAPDPGDGDYGRGLEVSSGARVEVARARFARQHEVAIIFGRTERSTLREVTVVDTRERGCVAGGCPDAPGGIGLGVYGGVVEVDAFRIEGVPLCGVQIAAGGELDLRDGVIRDVSVGACVQVDGYDVTRLADGVVYEAVGTGIQTTSHHVPEVQPPVF